MSRQRLTRDEVLALMDELGGTADLTLSSGDISDSWGEDMIQVLSLVSVLPEWRVLAEGNRSRSRAARRMRRNRHNSARCLKVKGCRRA